jgi:long-chain acyl-CoA synthetase
MQGYYENSEATAKVMRDDGWFVTGDLGWLTATGDLVITGRAKDTIVLSSGENVEPEPIEDACRKSSLVQQIVLVGNDQKTLGALVVPEFVALADVLGMSAETEPEEIVGNPEAAKIVRQSLSETMAADGRFKASESISKVHLLSEPFSDTNGMLTNTMKIKKNVVCEKYSEEIKALYR